MVGHLIRTSTARSVSEGSCKGHITTARTLISC